MRFGGGGGRATILMPDTSAYDRMFNLQLEAMRQQQGSDSLMALGQLQLDQALRGQQQSLTAFRDYKRERADAAQAHANRIAALIGPPVPEQSAKPPTIGSDRAMATKPRDRDSLRVTRAKSTRQGKGTGLNITTS